MPSKSKRYAKVDTDRCVACGACTNVCPRKAVTIFHGCFAQVDVEICVGCGQCERTCPAGSIVIKDREVAS